MVTDSDVVEFFRDNLPAVGSWTLKVIPFERDDILQAVIEPDDMIMAIDKFGEFFKTDTSGLKIHHYYP
ncbi:hypothetical protein C7M52_03313 [Mixta theicola]|nr:hypothetical protein [Mixta theicola]QHM77317.1 hypothetical protein C7M52_03313 [Mixta theicola]